MPCNRIVCRMKCIELAKVNELDCMYVHVLSVCCLLSYIAHVHPMTYPTVDGKCL